MAVHLRGRRKPPHEEILLRKRISTNFPLGWKMEEHLRGQRILTQDVVPFDSRLGSKIGIKNSEKVLVFAGHFGDWADALSKFSNVTYTDAAKDIVNYTKGKFGPESRIRRFKKAPAELVPQREKIFDWSFSFEPYPLIDSGLNLSLARSLLNKKGAKMVFRCDALMGKPGMGGTMQIESQIISPVLAPLSKLYGAKMSVKVVDFALVSPGAFSQNFSQIPCAVVTLETNANARKKVSLDLRVLKEVGSVKKASLTIPAVAEKFGVSESVIVRSIDRLRKLDSLRKK